MGGLSQSSSMSCIKGDLEGEDICASSIAEVHLRSESIMNKGLEIGNHWMH